MFAYLLSVCTSYQSQRCLLFPLMRSIFFNTCVQRSCQTIPVYTTEVEIQSKDVLDNSTQTDTQELISQTLTLDQDPSDFPGLLDFLRGVEDVVVKELVKNNKSHAFDGFEVNWEDQNETVRVFHVD